MAPRRGPLTESLSWDTFGKFFSRSEALMARALGKGSPVVQQVPAGAAVPSISSVLEELDRLLASADFDASPRSRDFVRYIVEETLAGRGEDLSQTSIATRVFGRREDFDATVDPIVRIQAGRLR